MVMYQLDLPPLWCIHNVFHTLVLSLYYKMREHGINYSKPTLDLIDGEPEWEVEQILASWCSGRPNQLQYLIKWAGYLESKNS